jgi:hypothetical protein
MMAMVEIKTREDFLGALMDRLVALKEANVLVIIETPTGIETMQTVPSMVWTFGILKAALAITDERFRSTIDTEGTRQKEEALAAQIRNSINNGDKGTN